MVGAWAHGQPSRVAQSVFPDPGHGSEYSVSTSASCPESHSLASAPTGWGREPPGSRHICLPLESVQHFPQPWRDILVQPRGLGDVAGRSWADPSKTVNFNFLLCQTEALGLPWLVQWLRRVLPVKGVWV